MIYLYSRSTMEQFKMDIVDSLYQQEYTLKIACKVEKQAVKYLYYKEGTNSVSHKTVIH